MPIYIYIHGTHITPIDWVNKGGYVIKFYTEKFGKFIQSVNHINDNTHSFFSTNIHNADSTQKKKKMLQKQWYVANT